MNRLVDTFLVPVSRCPAAAAVIGSMSVVNSDTVTLPRFGTADHPVTFPPGRLMLRGCSWTRGAAAVEVHLEARLDWRLHVREPASYRKRIWRQTKMHAFEVYRSAPLAGVLTPEFWQATAPAAPA